jgi:urease accessory protein
MGTVAQLLEQRSRGEVKLRFGQLGVRDLREAGSCKLRLPKGSGQAILINTSGGLAGGDEVSVGVAVESGSLTVTSQAAERVYRSLGPPAHLDYSFDVADGATLHWLPQETIMFEGAALSRRMSVQLHGGAEFIAFESVVFGREAMGERLQAVRLTDHWDVFRDGKLIHAERLALGPQLPRSAATLGRAGACATLLMISPRVDTLAAVVAEVVGENDVVSCWNGKLVARFIAPNGFSLRKALVQAVSAATGGGDLPKSWSY